MKKIILLVILAAIAWRGYERYRPRANEVPEAVAAEPAKLSIDINAASDSRFSCDGRTRCHQMTSCVEAKYFLKNCPGVKMDGDNDGVPCEQQLCN
jgi:Tfp pilus assembly major pilin PilA